MNGPAFPGLLFPKLFKRQLVLFLVKPLKQAFSKLNIIALDRQHLGALQNPY